MTEAAALSPTRRKGVLRSAGLAGRINLGIGLIVVAALVVVVATLSILPSLEQTLRALTEDALPAISESGRFDRALDGMTLTVNELAIAESREEQRSVEQRLDADVSEVIAALERVERNDSVDGLGLLFGVVMSAVEDLQNGVTARLASRRAITDRDTALDAIKQQVLARTQASRGAQTGSAALKLRELAWSTDALDFVDRTRALVNESRRYDLMLRGEALEQSLADLKTQAAEIEALFPASDVNAQFFEPICAALDQVAFSDEGLLALQVESLGRDARVRGLSNEVSTLISEFYFASQNRLEDIRKSADSSAAGLNESYGRLQLLLLVSFAVTVVVAAVVSIYLRVKVSSRLRALDRSIRTRSAKLMKQSNVMDEPVIEDGDEVETISSSVDYFLSEIDKQNEELVVARDAAQDATQAKSTFLASMSHEIRTPMNGIIGMVDLLKRTEMKPDQQTMLQTVQESGKSLLAIINDILDFSKIEAGRLDLEEVDISLTDTVEIAAQTIAPQAVEKGLNIVTYVDPRLPAAVTGDPVRTRQILINLGGNAIKFSENKDVMIRADLMNDLEAAKATGVYDVRFQVIDHGMGISPEAQGRLFQEFSQADSSTTRTHGGTGLGLAICKRLTDLMGGKIWVESELGAGSTFQAVIPFGAGAADEGAETPDTTSDLAGLRVLMTGTNADQLAACCSYLEHWQAEVTDVESVDDVMAAVEESKQAGALYDVIAVPDEDDDFALMGLRGNLEDGGFVTAPRLVVGVDPRLGESMLSTDSEITVMDINPLRRALFISAVAIAAGRASPEVYDVEVTSTTGKGKALSVDEALAWGTLILVAEDNQVNQDVIQRQLGVLGYTCEIANNGKEAFEMWQQKPYRMLLTDCHMPEWDGFELTAAIRQEEEAGHPTVAYPERGRCPIIAITANALQGEAEKCIAGGMDDYMPKPLEMDLLEQKVGRWMKATKGVQMELPDGAEPAAPTPVAAQAAPVAKAETVVAQESPPDRPSDTPSSDGPADAPGTAPVDERKLKDIFGDDPATFKEVMGSFIGPTERVLEELHTAYEARDAAGVRAAAHSLKSSSRSVGAMALGDAGAALETAGDAGDWDQIDAVAPQVQPLFDDVKRYIDRL